MRVSNNNNKSIPYSIYNNSSISNITTVAATTTVLAAETTSVDALVTPR